METWKLGVIAALVLSLLGFGVYQQVQENHPSSPIPAPIAGTPTPSPYVGKTLPAWNISQWVNTPKPVLFSSLKGKFALVEIFRTECPHCNDAAPFMASLDTRYRPLGLNIVGLQSPGNFKDPENPENSWADVQQWVEKKSLRYPIGFDEGSKYFQSTIKKQILGGDDKGLLYPTILILDPQGKVVFAQTGHDSAKAIALAVEIEKRLPSKKTFAERAKDLTAWLENHIKDLSPDPTMSKALMDDIEQRLMSKKLD